MLFLRWNSSRAQNEILVFYNQKAIWVLPDRRFLTGIVDSNETC